MYRTIVAALLLLLTIQQPGAAQLRVKALRVASGASSTPPCSGATTTVASGANLQTAINNAARCDTLLLEAGATFTGNFSLPVKAGTDYITIRTSTSDASLPSSTTRILPANSSLLSKIVSGNSDPALVLAAGAHHYILLGLEFGATSGGVNDIILLGRGDSSQNDLGDVPDYITLDRVLIRGDATNGQKRGISLHSSNTTIKNSYIDRCFRNGEDSQAIAGWNGPGPYLIHNNYLEAAGENLLFGGADPNITNLVPSNITITKNTLKKDPTWNLANMDVKNILELKNAQDVLIDGNILEYNWLDAQNGMSVLFTPRNQDDTAPWTVVQRVDFTNNTLRNVSGGINILGEDDESVGGSLTTNDILIQNNLFYNINAGTYGGDGRFLLINGGDNIRIIHNTIDLHDSWTSIYAYGMDTTTLVLKDNITDANGGGSMTMIIGDGQAPGNSTITAYFPSADVQKNVFAGAASGDYPTNNYYPADLAAVQFVDLAGRDYNLAGGSAYNNAASDSTDVGADIAALLAAQ